MFEGLWTVEFISTENRFGRGVLVINSGRLLGGDNGYYYSGSYQITNNTIEGTVNVTRFDPNIISVFGDINRFSITFSGEISEYEFTAGASLINNPEYQIRIVGNKKEDI